MVIMLSLSPAFCEAERNRLVHLDVEVRFEELLRQLSYAIKNQLVASKAPY